MRKISTIQRLSLRTHHGSRRLRNGILFAATASTPLLGSTAYGGSYSFTYSGATAGDFGVATFYAPTATFGSADTFVFNKAQPFGLITNTAAHSVGFITFDTGIGSVVLGTVAGGAFSLTSAGAIQNTTTLTGSGITDTVNAPIVILGATTTTGGVGSFLSNSGTSSNILNIGGPISGASLTTVSGGTTLDIGGTNTGANLISGGVSNGTGAGSLSVTKVNVGNWILSGTNTFTGSLSTTNGMLDVTGTALSAGTVQVSGAVTNAASAFPSMTLDYTGGQAAIVGSTSRLNFTDGTLTLLGTGSGVQTVGSIGALSNGVGTLVLNNEPLVVTSNTFARSTGATAFIDTSRAPVTFTSKSGTFGAVVVYDGTGIGIGSVNTSTGQLTRLTTANTTALPAQTGSSATNYYVSGTVATTGNVAANTLTIDSTSPGALTLAGTSSLALNSLAIFDSAGGALTGGSAYNINGGTLGGGTAASGELLFHQFSAGTLTVGSVLNVGGNGFSKDGPGALLVTSTNSFTGNVVVSGGTLSLGTSSSTGSLALATAAGTGALGAGTNNLYLGPTATVDLNGQYLAVNLLQGNGTITNSAAGNATLTISTGNAGFGTNFFIRDGGAGSGTVSVVDLSTGVASAQGFYTSSTFSGGLTVSTGNTATVLNANRYGVNGAYGTGTLTLQSGGTDFAGTSSGVFSNAIVINGNFNYIDNDAFLTLAGKLSGAGSVLINGNGSTTFTGDPSAFVGSLDIENSGGKNQTIAAFAIASATALNFSNGNIYLNQRTNGTTLNNIGLLYQSPGSGTVLIGALNAGSMTGGSTLNFGQRCGNFGIRRHH